MHSPVIHIIDVSRFTQQVCISVVPSRDKKGTVMKVYNFACQGFTHGSPPPPFFARSLFHSLESLNFSGMRCSVR